LNRDNWLVETTSSDKLFITLIIRTAKKCFLQLTLSSGTNNFNEWPRVLWSRTTVKKIWWIMRN